MLIKSVSAVFSFGTLAARHLQERLSSLTARQPIAAFRFATLRKRQTSDGLVSEQRYPNFCHSGQSCSNGDNPLLPCHRFKK